MISKLGQRLRSSSFGWWFDRIVMRGESIEIRDTLTDAEQQPYRNLVKQPVKRYSVETLEQVYQAQLKYKRQIMSGKIFHRHKIDFVRPVRFVYTEALRVWWNWEQEGHIRRHCIYLITTNQLKFNFTTDYHEANYHRKFYALSRRRSS